MTQEQDSTLQESTAEVESSLFKSMGGRKFVIAF